MHQISAFVFCNFQDMKKPVLFLSLFCMGHFLVAQQKKDSIIFPGDTLKAENLEEVILIANPISVYSKEDKPLKSLGQYLEESASINMIKRGAYAWEPMLNGMTTERSVITIDGMQIFSACTDKMDPVTSYVENTNLSSVQINEGPSGAEYGGTIAGAINLVRKKSGFSTKDRFEGSVFSGFESNNSQQIYGSALSYSSKHFFGDVDITYRDASNYKAGHKSGQDSEVKYSQFTKYNVSAITGFKINENQSIQGSLIFDKATDVGYPGLPMDVSLAEAVIASLQYSYKNLSKHLNVWETKMYFNSITHIMDDSHRPVVPIRMDMPGWSKTQGFYSKLLGSYKKHAFRATLSGYRNNSLAEMTMYPNDPEEKEMFMLTWPDVNTLYVGVNLEDHIYFDPHLGLRIQGGIGVHKNKIESELGLNSLRLFYPNLPPVKTRILKNISSQLFYHHENFLYQLELGYGERAPSVSEGYGFYLLNINDNYDYVGNPNLENEKSITVELSSAYNTNKFTANAEINYFYIMDYIIGKPKPDIPAMNFTANGIKIYEQLGYASIFNANLGMEYTPFGHWTFSADAFFRYGQGAEKTVLPLIQPFNYQFKAKYEIDDFFAEASLQGSTKNRNSIEFGETQKPAYYIFNLAISKNFALKEQNLIVKLGVENLFDRYYSTFADWFGIPRMGRNIYANVIYKFQNNDNMGK